MDSTTTAELSDVDTAPEGADCAFCGVPAVVAAEWEDGHRFWVYYCRLCFEREVPGEPDDDGDGPSVEALEVETDADGLPTVKGYRQLYLGALALLEEREPDWTTKQRERTARAMTEAYCQGAVQRMNMERGWA